MGWEVSRSRMLEVEPGKVSLLDRAAIVFTNKKRPGESVVPIKHLRLYVCFIEPRNSGLHVVRFAGYTASPELIGGLDGSTVFRNAAIGRRMCEYCWRKGSEANPTVYTRGDKVGRCERCDRQSDYLRLSLPPYLKYNQRSKDDLAVCRDTQEATIADELKRALMHDDVMPLRLPAPVKAKEPTVRCEVGFGRSLVFDTREHPLGGPGALVGDVRYELWEHRGRIADRKAHRARLRQRR